MPSKNPKRAPLEPPKHVSKPLHALVPLAGLFGLLVIIVSLVLIFQKR